MILDSEELYKALQTVEHTTVYRKEEIPKEYHYSNNRRIMDLLLVADIGYTVGINSTTYSGSM